MILNSRDPSISMDRNRNLCEIILVSLWIKKILESGKTLSDDKSTWETTTK